MSDLSDPRSRADRLASILERKRREIERRARREPAFEALLRETHPVASDAAYESLQRDSSGLPGVVAEIKYRSPSAGTLRERAAGSTVALAQSFEASGAAAISVLSDGPGFGGCVLDVRRAARAVSVPILFKEFVLHPVQLEAARLVNARLVLLIARVFTPADLASMVDRAFSAGLEPLVEAHDAEDLEAALDTKARIVGVNARDLRTFRVHVSRAMDLLEHIPSDRRAVFLSGVERPEDLARLGDGRADAVVVGTGLMSSPNPGERLRILIAEARRHRAIAAR